MKKKVDIKQKWCPLFGGINPDDTIIMRARELWGVKTIVQDNILRLYRPSKETIDKARAIYDRWDELQRDPLNFERLKDYLQIALHPETHDREEYLRDILFRFTGLNASGLEVFSILAIYEARVSKNPVWPLELLALTERYSPDAMRSKQVMNGASEGGKARAAQARIDRELAVKDWQARAEKLWAQSPALLKSKLETAKKIRRELLKENSAAPSITTIRQNIKNM